MVDTKLSNNQKASSNIASVAPPSVSGEVCKDVILIDGRWYSTKGLASIHPGGDLMVLACNGQDGTTVYNSYHRRAFPHDRYTQYLVPEKLVDPDVRSKIEPNHQDFSLYWRVAKEVEPIVAATKGFAPNIYFVKVLMILLLAFGLDFIYPLFDRRPLWLTAVLGWSFGLIGLNIQHDANHGAVSRNPLINRILGLTQDYIGGSSLMWIVHHNTIHHVHCNDVERDGDLIVPTLRLCEKTEWQMPHVMQQMYFVLLEMAFGPVHVVRTVIDIWSDGSRREHAFAEFRKTSRVLSFVYPLRFAILFLHCTSWWDVVTQMCVMNAVGGGYLAFFFLLSHNFVGVKKDGIDTTKDCFVRNQAETSSNVGYEVLCQFNGGLNYQIEHHLFPRIHHSYYPKIAPIVRKMLEAEKIQYIHFPTIWANFYSCFSHLGDLGKKPTATAAAASTAGKLKKD